MTVPVGRGLSRHPNYYSEPRFSDDETVYESEDDMPFFGRKGNRDSRMPYGVTARRRRRGGHGVMMDSRGYGSPQPFGPDEGRYFPDMSPGNQIRPPYGGTNGQQFVTASGGGGGGGGYGNAQHQHHHHHHHYVYNRSNPDSVPRGIECHGGLGPGQGYPPMLEYPRNNGVGMPMRPPALAGPMMAATGPAGGGGGGGSGGAGFGIGGGIGRGPGLHPPGPDGGCGACDCCMTASGRGPFGGGPGMGGGMPGPHGPGRSSRLLGW